MKKSLKLTTIVMATVALQSSFVFGYGITAKGIFEHGHPVHETMTKKAALDSGYIADANSVEMKNLISGVRFNDDPEAYLLSGNVLGFAVKFLGSNKDKKDPTEAFHFGNYQFMHAMAKSGLPAHKIKTHMMLYAYHCWLAATDSNSYAKFQLTYKTVTEKIKKKAPNTEYSREELIAKDMVKMFPKEVLFYNTDNQVSFQNRALGSLLHMIQDSYAKGHTVRVGWENGMNSGNILYFQDYKSQDSHKHESYDVPKSGKLNETTLFKIPGVDMAYLRSKQILEMAAKKCPWSSHELTADSACSQSVYSYLSDEVLALEKDVNLKDKLTHTHEELKKIEQDPNLYSGGQ